MHYKPYFTYILLKINQKIKFMSNNTNQQPNAQSPKNNEFKKKYPTFYDFCFNRWTFAVNAFCFYNVYNVYTLMWCKEGKKVLYKIYENNNLESRKIMIENFLEKSNLVEKLLIRLIINLTFLTTDCVFLTTDCIIDILTHFFVILGININKQYPENIFDIYRRQQMHV
jgi:hypothetical protein